jgi:hypothetical protein
VATQERGKRAAAEAAAYGVSDKELRKLKEAAASRDLGVARMAAAKLLNLRLGRGLTAGPARAP